MWSSEARPRVRCYPHPAPPLRPPPPPRLCRAAASRPRRAGTRPGGALSGGSSARVRGGGVTHAAVRACACVPPAGARSRTAPRAPRRSQGKLRRAGPGPCAGAGAASGAGCSVIGVPRPALRVIPPRARPSTPPAGTLWVTINSQAPPDTPPTQATRFRRQSPKVSARNRPRGSSQPPTRRRPSITLEHTAWRSGAPS